MKKIKLDQDLPGNLHISKSNQSLLTDMFMEKVNNIGSNLKVEKVFKDNAETFPRKLYQCGECIYTADSKSNLDLHMKGHAMRSRHI